jgi:membrane protease YdiL (CAAX protease family)
MDLSRHMQTIAVYGSMAFSSLLWFIIFVLRPFNFWFSMAASTFSLIIISCAFGWPILRRSDFTLRNIFIGLGSAGVLYFIFRTGNRILILLTQSGLNIFSSRIENLDSIYSNTGHLSPAVIGILLFFPIGFGEEFFWRGYIQRYFSHRTNGFTGVLITTFFYTLIHVPTYNPVLILAACVCGLFWGTMYWLSGNLAPSLISHMVWDPFIFIIFPVR